MAELREALAAEGFPEVKTYILSGNVILKSAQDRESIQSLVHNVILDKIGADITVIARTHDEIKDLFENNPFPIETSKRTYFTLFETMPEEDLIEEFIKLAKSPDEIVINQDSLYILFATKYSDSKFNNNFIERKLNIAATTRNFNTISRLLELSE